MYSEKTYKNYIFWIQVKRVVVIVILSCLGALLGILIGKVLESTVKLTSFNNLIIIISTVVFFLLGILLTAGTGKQVQDGYWRIAVLRKLTVIQKDLELNNDLLKKSVDKSLKKYIVESENEVKKDEELNKTDTQKTSEKALVPQVSKKIAKPKKKKR